MNVIMLLDMAASAAPDRDVVTEGGRSLTAVRLRSLAGSAAERFRGSSAVVYLGTSHLAYPIALFGAALARVPFVPVNYRLGAAQKEALLARHPGATVLTQDDLMALVDQDREAQSPSLIEDDPALAADGDRVAAIIYTSGTTSEPKAALLRHRHLLAYIFNTLDFGAAAETEASLVAVPPYHIAGLTNLLSNLYTGRRVVYLPAFDPVTWLGTVQREGVTHAMLVPTMLARLVDRLDGGEAVTPSLRSLAYGGSRMPRPVLEKALKAFPATGFVNAYGLTETASSICVLGPDDHREAASSSDPSVHERLGSVGRPLPGIEIEIRDDEGTPTPAGATGLVFVRGEQISGEYGGRALSLEDGWFPTRDLGHLDAGGYLFIEGRADDTIIRGGENIAPAEIEDVLQDHPLVKEAAVVGVPDPEWGQRLVAVVVGPGASEDELREWVRDRLRSSKTPDSVVFRADLPKTETGKLIRRELLTDLETNHA